MKEILINRLNEELIKHGAARLIQKTQLDVTTLRAIARGRNAHQKNAYKIAQALGYSEHDAVMVAREFILKRSKKAGAL